MFSLTPWKQKEKNGNDRMHPLARMRDEVDTLFDRFFGNWPMMSQDFGRENFWAVDVEETDKSFVIRAEAPGFEPDEFDIHTSGNVLTLSAEHKVQDQGKKEGYAFVERQVGRFQRMLALPAGVDTDRITAQYKNGVLVLELPKSEQARPKQIKVSQ